MIKYKCRFDCGEPEEKCPHMKVEIRTKDEAPMGVSQWLEFGKKYGYDTFFIDKGIQEYIDKCKPIENLKEKIISLAKDEERERIKGIAKSLKKNLTIHRNSKGEAMFNNQHKNYNQALDDLLSNLSDKENEPNK